eukprot:2587561-Prorocentrum_lima.AAC.1
MGHNIVAAVVQVGVTPRLLLWCSRCGGFAMSCTRSLQRPCLGAAAGEGQIRQKRRARQGKFP